MFEPACAFIEWKFLTTTSTYNITNTIYQYISPKNFQFDKEEITCPLRREEQKKMQEAARQKELDMLEKISDAETVRRLREEESRRREEEEWKMQAKLMVIYSIISFLCFLCTDFVILAYCVLCTPFFLYSCFLIHTSLVCVITVSITNNMFLNLLHFHSKHFYYQQNFWVLYCQILCNILGNRSLRVVTT